jgi:hypothetical protein
LYIVGDVSPTIEGLRITGGDATRVSGGGWAGYEYGGGVLVYKAAPTIRDCYLFGNVAQGGGGVYLRQSASLLESNVITANIANSHGGGLFLSEDGGTLKGNIVASNAARHSGGGLYSYRATMSGLLTIS